MDPTVRSTASDSNGNITTPVTTTAGVNNSPTALLGHVPLLPLPQHVITSGTRKDCIRLRGLPYEANVEHILEFLGEHSKNIVFQGVHMVYNSVVNIKILNFYYSVTLVILFIIKCIVLLKVNALLWTKNKIKWLTVKLLNFYSACLFVFLLNFWS